MKTLNKIQPAFPSTRAMYRVLSCIIIIVAGHLDAAAQNVTTSDIIWQADQARSLTSSDTRSFSCAFKTHGSQSIEWIQKNGSHTTTFQIINIDGTWEDFRGSGRIQYQVSRGSDRGKITIEKNETETFITVDFSEAGPNGVRQRFRINSVQRSN
jgi:hypothetical protein